MFLTKVACIMIDDGSDADDDGDDDNVQHVEIQHIHI